jgi:hypothetical protein
MPLPIPTLDDRRFDDLVSETLARVEAHTPEWTNIAPGDPGSALIDLFAWLTETILYRQNLIPLRQRRAFLNLLSLPMIPATPATGVISVDAVSLPLPAPLPAGRAVFNAGATVFTSTTDLQPTPLVLVPMIKASYVNPDPGAQARLVSMLRTLYSYDNPTPFVAQQAAGPDGTISLANAVDGNIWLALVLPKSFGATAAAVSSAIAGITLSFGLAPVADIPGTDAFDQATGLPPRNLSWNLITQDGSGNPKTIPLQVQADTSNGARNPGVALLNLPRNAKLLTPPAPPNQGDPMFAGSGAFPPELPVGITQDRVVLWLTLSTADAPALSLSCLAINAVGIIAQGTETNEPLGTATGASDATFTLSKTPVDPASLVIQVWQGANAATWTQVANFGAAGRNDTVFVLDPTAGAVTFGDGIRGMRPPPQSIIVAQSYKYGGGSSTNLAPGSIKAVAPNAGTVRHELATTGGNDGETVEAAEARIPAFLAHRDRCVTADDFQSLALATPGLLLGRADVVQGLMPGATADATRTGVPGVVSVFVFPQGPVAMGGGPVATLAQLKDVYAYLSQRILIGTQLFVLSAEPVPLWASVSVEILSGADPLATSLAVQQALAAYLWPLPPGGPDAGGWPLGRTVAPDELRTQAARVAGILAADQVALYAQSGASWLATARLLLKPWQVPALQGVSVATDGGAPPAPPDQSGSTGGSQTLVPYIPPFC